MSPSLRSVCLVAGSMRERNWRFQPWRYLAEVARQLAKIGHPISVLTDGDEALPAEVVHAGVQVRRLASVRNPSWKPNRKLQESIRQINPDIIIWHLGLTSLLYQSCPGAGSVPVVGIFTSPIYRFRELARLGPGKLLAGYRLSGVHLAGSLVPTWLLRWTTRGARIQAMVGQTDTTRRSLEQALDGTTPVQVIPPGVDEVWLSTEHRSLTNVRKSWGFSPDDLILLYYGSPAPLRGLPTLLRALAIAHNQQANLKLVVLSRSRSVEFIREDRAIDDLIQSRNLAPHVKVIRGFLEPIDLVSHMAAADIAALPFELLPSDAPLSVLEALSLGKPVVTTRVACLPELVSNRQGFLAEPADPLSLAEAIERATAGARLQSRQGPEPCFKRSWQEVGTEWSQQLQSL